MTNISKISDAAEAKAREASTPGTFNFLDRLASRNYPSEEVEIFLDERAAYMALKAKDRADSEADAEKADALYAEAEEWAEKARAERYILHVEGISSESYDECVDLANESYPIEYEEYTNPLTLQKTKTPLGNEDRDTLFRALLWSRFIRKIESPNGEVDDVITPEKVAAIMGVAPVRALIAVRDAVELLRMTGDWMDAIQTEDFFHKS